MVRLLLESGKSISIVSEALAILEQLPPQPLAFVKQEEKILFARPEVDDADPQRGPAFQHRRSEEEGSVADETVDDPAVDAVERLFGDLAPPRAVAKVQDREDRFGKPFEVRPFVDRRRGEVGEPHVALDRRCVTGAAVRFESHPDLEGLET